MSARLERTRCAAWAGRASLALALCVPAIAAADADSFTGAARAPSGWEPCPRCEAAPARPADPASPLALERLARAEVPDLVLAQRVIEREWTSPTDSIAIASRLPGAKSEPAAMLFSALVPGAGELYVGESSAYLFAAAEVAGWVTWALFRGDAKDLRREAEGVAGTPDDPASGWTYERWTEATAGDATELRRLYELDREAFYAAIASDDRYAGGWSDASARSRFGDLRDGSDRKLVRARQAETALWINHLLSAVDAFRAAHIHNLPLRRDLELRTSWRRGGPMIALTWERRVP